MSEPQSKNDPSSAKPADGAIPEKNAEGDSPKTEIPPEGQLSKEEQWAAFEKELKESDWGHQPC